MRRAALAASLAVFGAAAAGCPKAETASSAVPAATPAPSAAPAPATAGKGVVPADGVPAEAKLKAANGWNGQYRNLLTVIHAPEDEATVSPFSEYGWKEARAYKDYGPQPAGWWVYVEPYWFVWDTRNGERGDAGPGQVIPSDGKLPKAEKGVRDGLVDATTIPQGILLKGALGATAKYTNVLAAIHDPADAKTWSSFSERGWRETTSYKTYGQVPAGWWVYVEPYWLVWNLKDGQTGP